MTQPVTLSSRCDVKLPSCSPQIYLEKENVRVGFKKSSCRRPMWHIYVLNMAVWEPSQETGLFFLPLSLFTFLLFILPPFPPPFLVFLPYPPFPFPLFLTSFLPCFPPSLSACLTWALEKHMADRPILFFSSRRCWMYIRNTMHFASLASINWKLAFWQSAPKIHSRSGFIPLCETCMGSVTMRQGKTGPSCLICKMRRAGYPGVYPVYLKWLSRCLNIKVV